MSEPEARVALRVLVFGRVQGVGFREWVRRRAEALGLSGWVRNLGSGEVEALFSGERRAIEAMLRDCENGPRAARVEAVKRTGDADPVDGAFQVRATA